MTYLNSCYDCVQQKYVRAHFSYEGEIDEEVPCKELALSFTKGEILEISNQDDPDWWQVKINPSLSLLLLLLSVLRLVRFLMMEVNHYLV